MNKFLTLLEGGIIGAALLIIFDHAAGKIRYASFRNRFNHIYSRPTYCTPYRPYRDSRCEEDEEEEDYE